MKKIVIALIAVSILALSGCGEGQSSTAETTAAQTTQAETKATKATKAQSSKAEKETKKEDKKAESSKAETKKSESVEEENYEEDMKAFENSGGITKIADNKFHVKVNGSVFTASFADNSSAKEFKRILEQGDIVLEMSDYNGMEKVGDLGVDMPQNNEKITTEAGDIVLYEGSKVTIYYDKNTWNLTRLGKIQDITQEELKDILGSDTVEVTFSIYNW